MTLTTRIWTWLTRRLLGDESVGGARGYTVINADDYDEALFTLAGVDSRRELADKLDLPAYQSPVETLQELPDDPEAIYAWTVESEGRATALLSALQEQGVEDMDALHVVLTDDEELAELSYEDIRAYIDAGVEGSA
jgi:hypothetical protein